MPKEMLVAYHVDDDAAAGWLGTYGGEDSPCDMLRALPVTFIRHPGSLT